MTDKSKEEIGFTIKSEIEVKAPRELWDIVKDLSKALLVISMDETYEEEEESLKK